MRMQWHHIFTYRALGSLAYGNQKVITKFDLESRIWTMQLFYIALCSRHQCAYQIWLLPWLLREVLGTSSKSIRSYTENKICPEIANKQTDSMLTVFVLYIKLLKLLFVVPRRSWCVALKLTLKFEHMVSVLCVRVFVCAQLTFNCNVPSQFMGSECFHVQHLFEFRKRSAEFELHILALTSTIMVILVFCFHRMLSFFLSVMHTNTFALAVHDSINSMLSNSF